MEIWKDVVGFEGEYMVSSLGRLKSINRVIIRSNGMSQTIRGRILKPRKSVYLNIKLRKAGVERVYYVHTLVAMAFLGHVPNGHKLVVDHIDEDKFNNRLSNLQILTHAKNKKKSVTDEFRIKQRKISASRKRINGQFK